MLVYVRPSNEAINDPSTLARYLFRDGARLVSHCARPTNDVPSKLARFSLKGVAWISPQLRTSNDHSFIVGVP